MSTGFAKKFFTKYSVAAAKLGGSKSQKKQMLKKIHFWEHFFRFNPYIFKTLGCLQKSIVRYETQYEGIYETNKQWQR